MGGRRRLVAALMAVSVGVSAVSGCGVEVADGGRRDTGQPSRSSARPLAACDVLEAPTPGWPATAGSKSRVLVVLNPWAEARTIDAVKDDIASYSAVIETRTTTQRQARYRARGTGDPGLLAGLVGDEPYPATIAVDFPTRAAATTFARDYENWDWVLGAASETDRVGDVLWDLLYGVTDGRPDVELYLEAGSDDLDLRLPSLRQEAENRDGVIQTRIVDERAAFEDFKDWWHDRPDVLEDVRPADLPTSIEVRTTDAAHAFAVRQWAVGRDTPWFSTVSTKPAQLLVRQAIGTAEGRARWGEIAGRLDRVADSPVWARQASRLLSRAARTGRLALSDRDDAAIELTREDLIQLRSVLADCDDPGT